MNEKLRTYRGGVAVVTGAASGIGRALTQELVSRGSHVVAADLEIGALEELAERLNGDGLKVRAVELDVTDHEQVSAVVRRAADEHGRLDYIFNNAGIGAAGSVFDHSLDAWERVIDVNLYGVLHGIRAAYPIMREQGFGHIVNTASMAGLISSGLAGAYATTKYAVVGLSKTLRVEAAAEGVRVSVFCPGVIRTAIIEGGKHGILLDSPETRGVGESDVRRTLRGEFEKTRPMDPNAFATKALDQVAANRAIVVVPGRWKALWWLERLSPSLGERFARIVLGRTTRTLQEKLSRLRAGAVEPS